MSAPDLPERVTAYLERSGLGAEATTVLPLTGDASDRRYFRVLRRNGPVARAGAARRPFDPEALPFCPRRATAGGHAPADSGDSRSRGRPRHPAARGSGRHHAAGAPGRGAGGRTQPPLSLRGEPDRGAAAPRRRAGLAGLPAVRRRLRRGQAAVGARVLHEALRRGLPRGVHLGARSRRAQGGMAQAGRGTGRRAARAVSSRLPQPQPDAAPGRALHHRLPGRAHGARHLRPGVAAARLVRGSVGSRRSTSSSPTSSPSSGRRAAMRSPTVPGSRTSAGAST